MRVRRAVAGAVGVLLAQLALLALGETKADALSVVVPNSLAGSAVGDNVFPFDIGYQNCSACPPDMRYQQIYDASQFPGKIEITGIVFRPGANLGTIFAFVLPNVRIDLSTSSVPPLSLNPTFATNVGSDALTVFSGPLSLSSVCGCFDIIINFATPFVYDPTQGNLLLDVRNLAGGTPTPLATFDFVGATFSDPSVSRAYTLQSGINSPTADQVLPYQGLVTEFLFLPEPSTLLLLVAGVSVLAGTAPRWRGRGP